MRSGREYAWSSMEASNPELIDFLKDTFTMSCNHAYEVWQWMVNKGFYALSPAPQTEIDSVVSIFNEVKQ
ncbi:spore coat protein [Clostridium sp. CTA-5]